MMVLGGPFKKRVIIRGYVIYQNIVIISQTIVTGKIFYRIKIMAETKDNGKYELS